MKFKNPLDLKSLLHVVEKQNELFLYNVEIHPITTIIIEFHVV